MVLVLVSRVVLVVVLVLAVLAFVFGVVVVVCVVLVVYGVCCSSGLLCVALSRGSATFISWLPFAYIYTIGSMLNTTNNVITIPVCS